MWFLHGDISTPPIRTLLELSAAAQMAVCTARSACFACSLVDIRENKLLLYFVGHVYFQLVSGRWFRALRESFYLLFCHLLAEPNLPLRDLGVSQ